MKNPSELIMVEEQEKNQEYGTTGLARSGARPDARPR